MSMMTYGMWKARYWAVLGFQMLLVLFILAAIAGLITAGTLVQMVSTLLLAVGLSVMFWFMVKAMARIQMPRRPGASD
jgi:threonine/homoserine/homoserine lactone efflux protein